MSFCSLAVVADGWHDRHSVPMSSLSEPKIEFVFSSALPEDSDRVADLQRSGLGGRLVQEAERVLRDEMECRSVQMTSQNLIS